MFEKIQNHGPKLVVLVALAGLGWFGHRTGWKMPKLSSYAHEHGPVVREDWCETHNVAESKCLACHPELGGHDPKDWCQEHGVPESKCTVCHPDLLKKGTAADWCSEHGVPESQCTLCHPHIAVKGELPAPIVSTSISAEPSRTSETCQLHRAKIQFASAESVHKAGVNLEPVQERPVAARIEANGELDYDPTRVARVTPRVPGLLFRVEKRLGDSVKKGEVLAFVDSVEVGRAKADLLQAIGQLDLRAKTAKRVATSASTGLKTEVELQEAEAALREARIRAFNAQQALSNMGLACDIDELSALDDRALVDRVRRLGLTADLVEKGATANLLPVIAPLDGRIVAREGVAGEAVEPGRAIFVVTDTSRLWVSASLRLDQASRTALGQKVSFVPDGEGEEAVEGTLSWISTEVDEKTRTVRVRGEIENQDGRLRAHTFGRARILTRERARTPSPFLTPPSSGKGAATSSSCA